MKLILAAMTAATVLVGVAVSSPAEARCWWNGYSWTCAEHRMDRDRFSDRERFDDRDRVVRQFRQDRYDNDRNFYTGGGWRRDEHRNWGY